MEPEARYSVVGVVVLVLLAALTCAIVWLAAAGGHRDTRTYKVYFAKQSLEGLDVRSDVRLKGIRVGDVTSLSFSRNHAGAVEVTLAIAPTAPVLQSTRAVVDRNIITGLATVRLVTQNETSPPLEPNGDDAVAVIGEGASQFQQFSETVDDLARRADETLGRVNDTLSRENIAAIGETLDNLRVATRQSSGTLRRLDASLAKAGAAADALRHATTAAGDDFHQLAIRYESLGDTANKSLAEVSASVAQMTADVTALTRNADAFMFDSGLELQTTAREIRRSTNSVGDTARALADPHAALFGPPAANLGPGEEAP